jgi:hypothetical protein
MIWPPDRYIRSYPFRDQPSVVPPPSPVGRSITLTHWLKPDNAVYLMR